MWSSCPYWLQLFYLILINNSKNLFRFSMLTIVAVGNGGAASTREEFRDKSSYKPAR
jgi:hypothetical protein